MLAGLRNDNYNDNNIIEELDFIENFKDKKSLKISVLIPIQKLMKFIPNIIF
jgi:hypothetical protein